MGRNDLIFGMPTPGAYLDFLQDIWILWSNVCLGGLSTDHTNGTGNDNETWRKIHDYIGSFALVPHGAIFSIITNVSPEYLLDGVWIGMNMYIGWKRFVSNTGFFGCIDERFSWATGGWYLQYTGCIHLFISVRNKFWIQSDIWRVYRWRTFT